MVAAQTEDPDRLQPALLPAGAAHVCKGHLLSSRCLTAGAPPYSPALIEMIMVAWVYGCNRFLANHRGNVTCLVLEALLARHVDVGLPWCCRGHHPQVGRVQGHGLETSTGDLYVYPAIVQALGWFFELSPTILTLYPGWVLHRYWQKGYTDLPELLKNESWNQQTAGRRQVAPHGSQRGRSTPPSVTPACTKVKRSPRTRI